MPPIRHADAEQSPLGRVAGRQVKFREHLSLIQFRLQTHRNRSERGRSAFDLDLLPILEPALWGGEAKAKRFRYAIVIEVPILDQGITKHRKEMGVGGA